MIGLYAFATLIVYGIIIIGPITFIDWAFDVNLAYELEYYFETIFVSGSEAFRYLKFWLIFKGLGQDLHFGVCRSFLVLGLYFKRWIRPGTYKGNIAILFLKI